MVILIDAEQPRVFMIKNICHNSAKQIFKGASLTSWRAFGEKSDSQTSFLIKWELGKAIFCGSSQQWTVGPTPKKETRKNIHENWKEINNN